MPTTANEIETGRLLLRPWRKPDAGRLFDIHSRPEIAQWLSDDFDAPDLMADVEVARGRIEKYAEVFADPPQGFWAIDRRDGGPPAGGVVLKTPPNAEHGEVEIGWWLHPDSQGQGFATEAARAVVAHGFAGGLEEIWAVMYPANLPSRAVVLRLGMTDLGIAEKWYPGDSRIFRLTREEWSQGRP